MSKQRQRPSEDNRDIFEKALDYGSVVVPAAIVGAAFGSRIPRYRKAVKPLVERTDRLMFGAAGAVTGGALGAAVKQVSIDRSLRRKRERERKRK